MNTFLGIFWILFLFTFCFFAVHFIKLAQIGGKQLKASKTPPATKEEPPKKAEEKKQTPPSESEREPIYYIVERKRKSKSSFSAPKEIRFK